MCQIELHRLDPSDDSTVSSALTGRAGEPTAVIGNHIVNVNQQTRKELTVRGLIVGVIITLVFTAANVYFGLKAGLTFSTSIPAAVISMAML